MKIQFPIAPIFSFRIWQTLVTLSAIFRNLRHLWFPTVLLFLFKLWTEKAKVRAVWKTNRRIFLRHDLEYGDVDVSFSLTIVIWHWRGKPIYFLVSEFWNHIVLFSSSWNLEMPSFIDEYSRKNKTKNTNPIPILVRDRSKFTGYA